MAGDWMAGRRKTVLALVVLGHALIGVLFLRPNALTKVQLKENAFSLLLSNPPMPTPRMDAVPPSAKDTKLREAKQLPSSASSAIVDSAARVMTSSEAPPAPRPGIDWYQQARQAAGSQAELIFKELMQVCNEAALRGERRPECRKYKKPDAWVPEPKKFGVTGVLPYVRLGKRCILGLGFFGCGIGKLPEANGNVFDDGREPDRPRSSVPDPNE